MSLTYTHSSGQVIDSGLDIWQYDETGGQYTGEYV